MICISFMCPHDFYSHSAMMTLAPVCRNSTYYADSVLPAEDIRKAYTGWLDQRRAVGSQKSDHHEGVTTIYWWCDAKSHTLMSFKASES